MKLFNELNHNKLFLFGLLLKVLAITILAPEIQNKWFLNFIAFTIQNFSLSPWSEFLKSGGDPLSYPYGPVMLILQFPLSFVGSLIDNLNFASNAKNYFLSLGFKSSILIADISILLLLITLIKEKINIKKIKNYYFHQSKRWDLEFYNGIILKLPFKNINSSLKIYNSLIDNNKISANSIVDLRVPNNVILTNEEK